jgi:hypothetical protein
MRLLPVASLFLLPLLGLPVLAQAAPYMPDGVRPGNTQTNTHSNPQTNTQAPPAGPDTQQGEMPDNSPDNSSSNASGSNTSNTPGGKTSDKKGDISDTPHYYRWVDAQGQVHFSDSPPPGKTSKLQKEYLTPAPKIGSDENLTHIYQHANSILGSSEPNTKEPEPARKRNTVHEPDASDHAE